MMNRNGNQREPLNNSRNGNRAEPLNTSPESRNEARDENQSDNRNPAENGKTAAKEEQREDSPAENNAKKDTPHQSKGSNWSENPALNNIDPAKLQMLLSMANQAKGKNQSELLPFLMSSMSQPGNNKMNFSREEMDTIINVMKIGKSPQEIRRIDRMCSLLKQMRH